VSSLEIRKKQSTSGLAENPRWRPEMSAKTLKYQYIGDRLTDHYKIFMQASYHHETQQTEIYFRFGPKSKMAAGNKYRKTKIAIS